MAKRADAVEPPRKMCGNCDAEFANQNPFRNIFKCAQCGLISKKPKLVPVLTAREKLEAERAPKPASPKAAPAPPVVDEAAAREAEERRQVSEPGPEPVHLNFTYPNNAP